MLAFANFSKCCLLVYTLDYLCNDHLTVSVSQFYPQTQLEPTNAMDPYAVACTKQDETIIGHLPREISRYSHYFIKYGGVITAEVTTPQRRPSPIAQGGLEIQVCLTAKISQKKKLYLNRFQNFIQESYLDTDSEGEVRNDTESETESEVVVRKKIKVETILLDSD